MIESVDIKDLSGITRFSTPINEGSKRKFLLMKEDYITLKFSVGNPIYFKLGDGIDNELGVFELVDLCKPTFNQNTGGYDYELRLDAYYWKWKNKKFFFTPEQAGREASWNLTANLDTHMEIFRKNLKALGYKFRESEFICEIGDTVENSSKLVSYDNCNLIDALTQMAEAWECEWWITNHTINFGRCEYGDPVDFKVGDSADNEGVNVNTMQRSDSQATYATRIYAFGSTRNIPPTYRKKLVFDVKEVDGGDISDTARKLDAKFFPFGFLISPDINVIYDKAERKTYPNSPAEHTTYIPISDLSAGTNKISEPILTIATTPTSGGKFWGAEVTLGLACNISGSPSNRPLKIVPASFFGDQKIQLRATFENISFDLEGDATECKLYITWNKISFDWNNIDIVFYDSINAVIQNALKSASANVNTTFTTGSNKGKTYSAVYNPDFLTGDESNIIRLPEGITASLGDTYTIDNIIKGKVPVSYFSKDDNETTINGVVQTRLMLPVDVPYVDSHLDMTQEESIEEIVVFEDEYAKYTGTTTEVPKPEIEFEKDEDDKPTKNEYLVYTFKDAGLKNFSEDFRLKGEELRLIFQTGKLSGLDFALKLVESDNTGTTFTIIRNDDYGRFLPDDVLFPQADHTEDGKEVLADTYILHGFDTAFLSEDMLPNAEKALLKKAQEYVKKSQIDPSTYNCDMFCQYAYNDGNIRTFEVGDRVNLINKAYFENGRQSRIIGYEWNLDIPYDHPIYTVGETAAYSRLGAIESKVDSLSYKGQSYTGGGASGGGSSVYVIGVNDKTLPSDRNTFSAKRIINEIKERAISREHDDTVAGHLTLEKGATSEGLIQANGGLVVRSHQTASQLDTMFSSALLEEAEGNLNVLGLSLLEEGDGNPSVMSTSLLEEVASGGFGGGTLGDIENVDKSADDAPDGAVLVAENKKWLPKLEAFLNTGIASDGTQINNLDALLGYINQLAPAGVQRNLRINNNLESKNVSASKGDPCPLSFTFISQQRNSMNEPYEDTGERGLCQVSVKNTDNTDFTVVKQLWITSGFPYSFDCAEWLTSGSNNIMIKVTGEITEETTPAFVYTVQLTSLSLTANNFKWWTAYTGDITMPLNIGGNVNKTLYVIVAGTGYKESYTIPIGTGIYTETAYNYVVKHPARTGVYNISAYVTNSDGTIRTRTISFNVICAVLGTRAKLIAINNILPKATNWSENSLFDYAMYDGDNVTTAAEFIITKEGDSIFSSREDSIATATKYTFSFPLEIDTIDNTEFSVVAKVMDGSVELAAPITIWVSNTAGYSAVAGSSFYLNPKTRSNRQDNYKDIVNEIGGATIAATWENMNWGNDGWTTDPDGNRLLRVMAGSLLTIDHKPFAKECARIGKTFEIDYVVTNVTDFTEPVITISTPVGSSFIGLNVYADDIIMYSQSLKNKSVQSLHTFEEKRIRLTLTILPDAYGNSGFNLCNLYINGIKNRQFTYENNDYFAHQGNIVIGSDFADIDIYGIREYPFALTSQGVLNNYVNFLSTIEEKVAIRTENDILDSNGSEIDFDNVKDQFNVLVYDKKIPSMAEQTTRVGTLYVYYFDHPEWNVTITNVTAKGQGTSSMKYYIWNTRYQLDKSLSEITHADGTVTKKVWQFVPGIPSGQKFTAKKNYASSMQSHKIGAVNSYDDLFREVGLHNEAMLTEKYKDARVSVYQLPFLCFEKSVNEDNEMVHTFKGLYTMGPDKGDKYCFGHDTDLFPGLIAIEGSDNSPLCTLFRVPWNTSGRIVYNEDEEAFQYNGANSWDFGAGDVANISKFIPAYNLVYQCSTRIKPFVGTLDELNAQISTLRTQPCEFWIAKAGDANQYNVYYLEAAESRFIPSDIGDGTINLVSQLVDKGYGISAADIAGKTPEALNALFVSARVSKFRAEAPRYWDIEDSLFFMNNVEFHAGTDERAKNTYPYNFGTETSKWRWRVDDADTRFDTTNRGLPDKSYSVETHDVDENGAAIWNGETNNFFNLMELAFQEEKITSMRGMMTAMQKLGGLNSGSELDKIYAFYKKYYFSQAQEYFPENAYNADAKFCYENGKLAYINGSYTNDTDPITQSLGDHYLAEQRWITKRIIYMMSKYSYGLFSANGSDIITVRAAGNTIRYELTPAMDMYPAIANGTSIIRGERTKAGEVCRMEIELSGSGDQQNIIQGASHLQDIGDWFDKNVSGSMGIQGRMLRDIRLGSKTGTVIISIISLNISNCVSLQRLLLSNIKSLSGSLNLLPCTHLQEVYADGTSLVQLRLPIGGGLRIVEYSSFNQYLTLQNYPLLTNAGVGIDLCKGVITDFFVVDCPKMNPVEVLFDIMTAQAEQGIAHALKRVRAVGFNETYNSSVVLDKLAELANGSYEGLSSDGLAGEDELPVLDGTLNVFANAYEDAVNTLKETFKKLLLTVIGKMYSSFKDSIVEEIVSKKWGDGVGITNAEIAGVTYVSVTFRSTNITYFDEFKKFTNAKAGVEDRAFQDCFMLKSISLPEQYKDSNSYRMFYNCISLEKVTIPDSFTQFGGSMFGLCKSLKQISLPSSLVSINNYAFQGSGLEAIIIPNGVESLGARTFDQCNNLEIAIIGENINLINEACFEDCWKMKTIVLKTKIPPTYKYNAMGWNNTSNIYVPDEALAAYKSASGWSGNNIKARLKPLSEYTSL